MTTTSWISSNIPSEQPVATSATVLDDEMQNVNKMILFLVK
ncbi:hypothetical protein [Chryseobacterium metallicongregator]|nr:hypothetical protein [Chryseobacterium sp. ES2]